MERKTLGDVCDFYRGLTYSKKDEVTYSGNVVLRANNIDLSTKCLNFSELKYLNSNLVIPKDKKLSKNTIFICMSSGSKSHLGKVAFVDKDYAYAFGGFMGLIKPYCEIIIPKYLFYLMITSSYKEFVNKLSNGININNIKFSDLKSFTFNLPSLEEQQRIVNILDKAEEIRIKKKLANEKLDEFLKSTFIDMFGDPMSNNINIKKEKLGKYLVYVQNGISRRRKIPQNIGNLVFRIKEIRENYIDYSDINRIPLNEKEKDKYKINNNELLFIRVNGNKDYVGRNAVFRGYIEDAYFNDHIMRVKIEERYMNPIYLSRFLNMSFGKEEIRKYIKTSAGQYTINQQGLSSVELTIPPIEQQNQFAQIVQKVEAQKEKNQKVIEQMDNLFSSLMQQAFNSSL